MSLTESVYNIPVTTSAALRAEQFCVFFENILGLSKEVIDDSNTVFWLDEKKTCGFNVYYTTISSGATKIYPYSGVGTKPTISDRNTAYGTETNIYYHMSKNGNVIAWREESTSFKFVAAKDDAGDWYIFYGNYLTCKSGVLSVQNEGKVDSSAMFTAIKMPTVVSDKMFTELYKIISATSFVEANTIVSFNGRPYKVCSVSASTSSILPCFAFPVE